jgi:iron(III) transport system substrate-binding protein
MNKPRLRLVAVVGVLIVNVVACGGGGGTSQAPAPGGGAAPGQPVEGDLNQVCAAGAQEGTFEYWATFEDENWQQIVGPFNAAYPGINVQLLALRGEDQLQRILTADAAGQAELPDAVSSGMDEIIAPIASRNLVNTEVDWAALGVPGDIVHLDTNSVRVSRTAIGLGYNTETTSPEDLPDTWEELIDPRFARNIVVDPRGRPFSQLGLEWGEERTLDYVQRLMDVTDPLIIEGGTAGMTAVLTGEAMISTGGRSDSALELQADGAPIAVKYLDVIPTEHDFNALIANAEHPNAAMCFIGWLASPEGTQVFQEVEFKQNQTIPQGAPADAVYVAVEAPEQAELVNGYEAAIRGIIEGAG